MNVAISPHLDDAVFSCGDWLAAHPGTVVVTVFAGVPANVPAHTEWDARCGFTSAMQAITVRRAEDHAALEWLGCTASWLPFSDAQYGDTPSRDALAAALDGALRGDRLDTLLMPIGLFHSDHLLVHAALRTLLPALRPAAVIAYEDVPYRSQPGLLQERLRSLAVDGIQCTPLPFDACPGLTAKRQAQACYESQLRAFGARALDDIAQAGRYWSTKCPDPLDVRGT